MLSAGPPHVVQQQVRERMDSLITQLGHGMIRAGGQRGRVTLHALGGGEQLFALQRLRVGQIAPRADAE